MNANEGESAATGAAEEPISVEISDLAPTRPGGSPQRADTAPRRPRSRALRVLALLGPILVALVVMLASFPSVRDRAGQLVFGPPTAPTATLEPDGDAFYILTGVPWATVSLDGRPLGPLPVIGRDPPLLLARGRHLLRWHGPPFNDWQCAISVPVSAGDSCPFDRGYSGSHPTSHTLFWVLTLYPNLNELPPDSWSALVASAQAALDIEQSSDIVQPGEQYVDGPPWAPGMGGPVASQPLRATLSFHLEVQQSAAEPVAPSCGTDYPNGCTWDGWDCRLLCTVPGAGWPAYWTALAPVYGTWDFATLAGKPVATDQPDGQMGVLTPLRVTWDGAAWHVALASGLPGAAYTSLDAAPASNQPGIGSPACANLRQAAPAGDYPLAPTFGQSPTGYVPLTWRFVNAAPLAAGCVGIATRGPSAPGTPPPLPPAYVLQRFGVLLAGNTLAQQLWPALPLGNASEQALAHQLASAPNSVQGGSVR